MGVNNSDEEEPEGRRRGKWTWMEGKKEIIIGSREKEKREEKSQEKRREQNREDRRGEEKGREWRRERGGERRKVNRREEKRKKTQEKGWKRRDEKRKEKRREKKSRGREREEKRNTYIIVVHIWWLSRYRRYRCSSPSSIHIGIHGSLYVLWVSRGSCGL